MKRLKTIVIAFSFLSLNAFASSPTVSENDKGELVIQGQVYPDVLNNNTYLMDFMGQLALIYDNRNSRAYFTFNEKGRIRCIYNSTRSIFNGFLNRNAICDLNLEIQFAIDNYSNIISKINNKGSGFALKRYSEGGLVADQDLSVTLFQDNKSYSIKIKYNDLNDYIAAKPNVVVKDGDKVSLTSADYFILYKKSNDGYKIDQILFKSDESKHQGEKEEYKKFQVSY